MITPGNTFHWQAPLSNKPHLYIVIAISQDRRALCANITTTRRDPACVLDVGDHRFVKKESEINYVDAVDFNIKELEDNLKTPEFREDVDMSSEVLAKVRDGAKISEALDQIYLDFFKA